MNVADRMPASWPSVTSSISTSKPRRSAQRVYMRSSISAQSCASVPPAPRMDLGDRVALVVLAAEQAPQLEGVEALGERADRRGELELQAGIGLARAL